MHRSTTSHFGRVAAVAAAFGLAAALTAVPTRATSADESSPVKMAISIHVEGWRGEDTNREKFEHHRAVLVEIADAAEEESPGAKLTFELNATFVSALHNFGDDFVTEMAARGHGVGVHADVGGTPLPPADFAARLTSMKAAFDDLGVPARHVSGICSASPWVEAAVAAGFEATTGMVAFCLKSLPTGSVPPEYADLLVGCDVPSVCHEQVPTDMEHKAHPWRTSTSADWLTADPEGQLLLIAGESGGGIPCAAEAVAGELTGGGCDLDAADAEGFGTWLDEYAEADDGRPTSFVTAWSVGSVPDMDHARALFRAAADRVASGRVAWATVADIIDAEAADAPVEAEDAGDGHWWITNPTSGARLWTTVVAPDGLDAASPVPAVVLVPGGSADGSTFLDAGSSLPARFLADSGYVAVVFDPDGRGASGGSEDYDGSVHQDGLSEIVRWIATYPGVDPGRVGLVSRSYGVTMATGAITRHPEAGASFLIDWEGPVDRNDTGGCDAAHTGHLAGVADCSDETFWSEREAATFAAGIDVPYVRLQSRTDHAQPDSDSALMMVNTVLGAGSPQVQLNRRTVAAPLVSIPTRMLLADRLDRKLGLVVTDILGALT
ncbi:MAG: hypothetical protein IT198_03855 [Acidimicrobiia bacterium]|nr:hypothetical protein [Acidimicrobiia bacterium]